MRTIWKTPVIDFLRGYMAQQVELPATAKILHVGVQLNRNYAVPTAWWEVDTGAKLEARTLFIVGTGDAIPEAAVTHLGTWQDGPYVWHMYSGISRNL